MSGLVRGIGKVFRGVVKVVKKIALPALAVGAVIATGGAMLGAAPLLGAGGAAAAAGASTGAATAAGGVAAGGGGLGGFLSGLFGGGGTAAAAGAPLSAIPALGGAAATAGTGATVAGATGAMGAGLAARGLIGGVMNAVNTPIGGALLMGAAQGWSQGAQLKEQEQQGIRAEERVAANYAGVGDATSFGSPGAAPRGLGVQPDPQQQVAVNDATAVPAATSLSLARPRRPGLAAATPAGTPRYRYDPAKGRIDFS